jgi:DNA polymerase elongation subunit (family B)
MKILILDIETAPNKVYAWQLFKQNIGIKPGYTLCWAAKWLGDPKNKTMYMSVHDDGEKNMVKGIWKLINEADAVIHYNGNKFDIPKLNQEFLNLGMNPPAPAINIDVYLTIRSRFKLTSNKLDFVARFLGIEGKYQHKGMSLWHDCMEGDPKAWKIMKRYNIQDIYVLEAVYKRVLPWIKNHPNPALFDVVDKPTCPTCGGHDLEKRGKAHTNTQSYQRFACKSCGKWSRGRTTLIKKDQRENILVNL